MVQKREVPTDFFLSPCQRSTNVDSSHRTLGPNLGALVVEDPLVEQGCQGSHLGKAADLDADIQTSDDIPSHVVVIYFHHVSAARTCGSAL